MSPRKVGAAIAALCLVALVVPFRPASADVVDDVRQLLDPPDGVFKAGVGIADATWHIGAGGGQYADKGVPTTDGSDVDPHLHSLAQVDSYGVASRLTMRALVLEGTNGRRIALVKSDNYLAQNHLVRRVGQLLQLAGSSITADEIIHSATHNHSSPYYSTPSWGVFIFQDVMDLRAFEYQARAIRDAILAAEANLQPAVMGAMTIEHTAYKDNIGESGSSEDGTPYGYPDDFGDTGITVMRYDNAETGKPIAVYANWGQHPESNDGYDLITADYLGPLERFVEREVGAPLVFSQSDVGSAEGPYFRSGYETMEDGVVRAWAHVGHAQTERGAKLLADDINKAWKRIGQGHPQVEVPMTADVPVDALTYWAPGPVSHPYPAVSNCRTQQTAEGDTGMVVTGLPDCDRSSPPEHPLALEIESLESHGIPVPDHYDALSFSGVQENLRIQLQVARVGEVILGSCSCEAQADLILNFESRANDVEGDIYDGYPWDEHCVAHPSEAGMHLCPHPSNPDNPVVPVTDEAFQRMKARIHNDAAGWDAPEYAPFAGSEAANPADIKGNFTKEELAPGTGYKIAVGLGHTGDYNGYVVSYHHFMAHDGYRKALTAWGPHTADYMVTRLVRMARNLRDGTPLPIDPMLPAAVADEARQEAMSQALGRAAGAAYDAWQTAIAPDLPAQAVTQPEDITRFDAAFFTWRGGSNAVDNPTVRVERLKGGAWVPFADQSGEVQTMLDMPDAADLPAVYAGQYEWHWTAGFEAFDGFPESMGQTPAGTYRFVVDGTRRDPVGDPITGKTAYTLTSEPFEVTPWDGIEVDDLSVDEGDVTFTVPDSRYPRTYESPFRFVRDDGNPVLCKTCSFRPWASSAEIASVTVDVVDQHGETVRTVEATRTADGWVADTNLDVDEVAWIDRGNVRDEWGEINGSPYVIGGDGTSPAIVVGDGAAAELDTVPAGLPVSSSRPPTPAVIAAVLAIVLLATIARKATS